MLGLPLFANGREEQRITFSAEEASQHARQIGFRFLSDTTAVIRAEDLPSMPIPTLGTTAPSEKQMERIKQRIEQAAALLSMARDDFESSFGKNEMWEELDDLPHAVADEAWRFGEYWQDFKSESS